MVQHYVKNTQVKRQTYIYVTRDATRTAHETHTLSKRSLPSACNKQWLHRAHARMFYASSKQKIT